MGMAVVAAQVVHAPAVDGISLLNASVPFPAVLDVELDVSSDSSKSKVILHQNTAISSSWTGNKPSDTYQGHKVWPSKVMNHASRIPDACAAQRITPILITA